jgi:hypothetical protein
MPRYVFSNNIAMPDRRKVIQEAVVAGIGSRPESETWVVSIFQPQDRPEYVVKIEGPGGFTWERTFWGPEEMSPEFIRQAVHQATHQVP